MNTKIFCDIADLSTIKKLREVYRFYQTLLINMMKQLFAAQMHQGENYIKLLIYVKEQVNHFELYLRFMK